MCIRDRVDAVQVFLPAVVTSGLALYFLRNGEKRNEYMLDSDV